MVMVNPSKTRIGGSRSSRGCTTCRSRRIKCDETQPSCYRCITAKRNCVYVEQPKKGPKGLQFVNYGCPLQSVTSHSSILPEEQRALDYFANVVSVQLGRSFIPHLWTKTLLTMCTHEPAVRYGVITLSAFYEAFVDSKSAREYENGPFAWKSFERFLSGTKALNLRPSKATPQLALATCLVFCTIENLRGLPGSSMRFVKQGVSLLASGSTKQVDTAHVTSSLDETDISTLFLYMATSAMACTRSYHRRIAAELTSTRSSTAQKFKNAADALTEISMILDQLQGLKTQVQAGGCETDCSDHISDMALTELRSRHDYWVQEFNNLSTQFSRAATCMLRSYEIYCSIMLQTVLDQSEAIFDGYTQCFEEINKNVEIFLVEDHSDLGGGEVPRFTVALGVLPVLCFCCWRCRDPIIRRHALHLMKSYRRREGIWDNLHMAQLADCLIEYEESQARQCRALTQHLPESWIELKSAADVPNHVRVAYTEVDVDKNDETVEVRFCHADGSLVERCSLEAV